jgi:AAA domain
MTIRVNGSSPQVSLETFRNHCDVHASLVASGVIEHGDAISDLQAAAGGFGLGGEAAQSIILEAFDRRLKWDGNYEAFSNKVEAYRAEIEAKEARTARIEDEAKASVRIEHLPTGGKKCTINIKTAASLRCKGFNAIKYIVPGYIVEGCTILAGRPKLGKSWLMLDIGLAVARGDHCLGGNAKCVEGDVLYLALEDNERRLQNRMTRVMGYAGEWPERFHYATDWPRAENGGLDEIRKWIETAEKPRLVVVDVLAMFRSPRRKDQQPYEADYAAIQGLQAIASQTGVAIVIVHHLRKSAGEVDPFEKVSGTLGLSGAADTVLILDRDAQGTTLYGRGRHIEEIETAVQFSKETCRWRTLGAAEEVRRTDERTAILDILKEAGEPMCSNDIADAIGMARNNVRQLLFKMAKDGEVTKAKRGRYQHPELVIDSETDNKRDNKSSQQNGASGRQNDVCYRSPHTPDNIDNNDNKCRDNVTYHRFTAYSPVISVVTAGIPEPITSRFERPAPTMAVTDVIDVIGTPSRTDNKCLEARCG